MSAAAWPFLWATDSCAVCDRTIACRTDSVPLCDDCRSSLGAAARVLALDTVGLNGTTASAPCLAGSEYRGIVPAVVEAYKRHGRRRLAALLAELLIVPALRTLQPGRHVRLVPVPASRRGRRERGFDQACRLVADLPWMSAPVLRRRGARAQKELGRDERIRHAGAAFEVRPGGRVAVAGREVVVIDDVVTTGATVSAAAAALGAAGATVIGAVAMTAEL